MSPTSHLGSVLNSLLNSLLAATRLPVSLGLLAVLGASTTGCVDTEDEVVFAQPTSGGITATGLRGDCRGTTPGIPLGRLRGLVYSLPLETRQLPDFQALRPVGALCMDGLDVTERRGYPGFPGIRNRVEWFGIDFEGGFVVTEPGLYHFRLTSDDGSRLYIDDTLVIDNDGFHATRAAEGDITLAAGPHRIGVPYWQGPGPFSLVLEAARPGEGYDIFHLDHAT